MALDAGVAAALVLTGETTADDARRLTPPDTPELVLDPRRPAAAPAVWTELGWAPEPSR